MSLKNGTIEYKLLKSFEYSSGAIPNKKAKFITLCEPGIDHVEIYADIKDLITSSIAKAVEKLDPDEIKKAQERAKKLQKFQNDTTGKKFHDQADKIEDDAEKGSEFIQVALMQLKKTSELLRLFKSLILLQSETKICIIDGTEALNDVLWNRLSADDAINMAYKWAFFFGTPSEMREATLSDQQSKSQSEVKAE